MSWEASGYWALNDGLDCIGDQQLTAMIKVPPGCAADFWILQRFANILQCCILQITPRVILLVNSFVLPAMHFAINENAIQYNVTWSGCRFSFKKKRSLKTCWIWLCIICAMCMVENCGLNRVRRNPRVRVYTRRALVRWFKVISRRYHCRISEPSSFNLAP